MWAKSRQLSGGGVFAECVSSAVGHLAVRHIRTSLQACARHVVALMQQACWYCWATVPGAWLPTCQVPARGIQWREPHTIPAWSAPVAVV